jgi:hypothetical protein
MTLSEAGLELVLKHEVGGGQRYYDKFLSRPTVPGFESGVTIGVGFDIGYVNAAEFSGAWGHLVHAERLRAAIGLKGAQARAICAQLADIVVPWSAALQVFLDHTCPTHWVRTLRVFPQTINLPEDSAAALFSLVFNRGPGLTGERRSEMRGIKDALATGHRDAVPGLIRSMKRLWPETSGLVRRREDEARLFETGLKNG